MVKKIEIEFEKGGKFIATMLEEEAPRTSNAIWNALPREVFVWNAMWSGHVTVGNFNIDFDVNENPKRILQPGDLAFEHRFMPAGPANNPWPRELKIVYGPRNLMVSHSGYPIVANHFAKITEGDLGELAKIGARIWKKGGEKVSLLQKV